jgi:hypothetical protein
MLHILPRNLINSILGTYVIFKLVLGPDYSFTSSEALLEDASLDGRDDKSILSVPFFMARPWQEYLTIDWEDTMH